MALFCDLHLHSTASDGSNAPVELAALAKKAGLGAIALTDHDTTAGLPECAAACAEAGVRFIPGIELSADPDSGFADYDSRPIVYEPPLRKGALHILGYGVRHDDARLATVQEKLRAAREQRNPQLVENLTALGVRITYDEVLELVRQQGGSTVGRPHIAQVMIRKGYVKSVHEAFARYIGEGAAAYVRKDLLTAEQAIAAIHEAGGVAVLAHPVQLRCIEPDEVELYVRSLRDLGLDGIETRHSDHDAVDAERYEAIARHLNLLTTGGSDYHGSRKAIELGSQKVPIEIAERLCAVVG